MPNTSARQQRIETSIAGHASGHLRRPLARVAVHHQHDQGCVACTFFNCSEHQACDQCTAGLSKQNNTNYESTSLPRMSAYSRSNHSVLIHSISASCCKVNHKVGAGCIHAAMQQANTMAYTRGVERAREAAQGPCVLWRCPSVAQENEAEGSKLRDRPYAK